MRMSQSVTLAVLSIWLLVGSGTPSLPAPAPESVAPPAAPAEEAGVAAEAKLRKLHLVRPDLIPFPLSYDVYC